MISIVVFLSLIPIRISAPHIKDLAVGDIIFAGIQM